MRSVHFESIYFMKGFLYMKRILCYGDSNTWGHDPDNGGLRIPEQYLWTSVLQQELGSDFKIIDEGLPGRSTAWDMNFDPSFNGYKYFVPCLNSHFPLDLIIIMLGTNDLQQYMHISPAQTCAELKNYISYIRSSASEKNIKQPQILLVSPIKIENSIIDNEIFNPIFGDEAPKKSILLIQEIEKTASECGVLYMRASDYAKASDSDGLHMNKDNHVIFGKALSKYIKQIL